MGARRQTETAGIPPPTPFQLPLISPAQAQVGIVGNLQGPLQLGADLHLIGGLGVEGGKALRIGVTGPRGALGHQDRPHVRHWQARGLSHRFMALAFADQAPHDRGLVAPGIGPADAAAVPVIPEPLHDRPIDVGHRQRAQPVGGSGAWVDQVRIKPAAGLEQAHAGHRIELVVPHARRGGVAVGPRCGQSQIGGAQLLRPRRRRREALQLAGGIALCWRWLRLLSSGLGGLW